jgi:hypothetical protein
VADVRVVELRNYVLRPGAGDEFVALFDRELVDTQEEHGLNVIGQFLVEPDDDHFVWLRGFIDMDSRRQGLSGFYAGPTWKAHGPAANALMVDSDDVLLLRPVLPPAPSFAADPTAGPLITITVWPLPAPAEGGFLAFFADKVEPLLVDAGAPLIALLVTDPSPNAFPALPVREGEQVLVRISRCLDPADHLRQQAALASVADQVAERTSGPAMALTLAPTPRSRLR